jgi:Cu(I)/Ag(I) efflux system membrane fusion protein
MMTQGDDREPGADDDPMSAPADFLVQLAPVMDAYLDLQAALAGDDLGAATRAAAALGASTRAVAPSSSATTNAAWNAIAGHLRAHSDQASAAEQLGTARTAFYPLSEQVERLVRVFGNPSREPLQLMHCPMAHDGDGASWLQRGDAVANPYYGPSMLTCGASALSLPVADTAAPPPPPVRRPSRATRAASPRMAPTRMAPAGMAPPGMSTASPTAHPPGHHH